MQHILIPTDFSIKSLNAIHALAARPSIEKVQVSLFHLLQPENDITQIFKSRRRIHMQMVSQEFYDACQILQNRYSSVISKINIEFGFGTTAAYLSNLLEGLKVDVVLLSPGTQYHYSNKRSIDPISLLKKTGVSIEIAQAGSAKPSRSEKNNLNALPVKELMIPKEEEYVVAK